MKQVMDSLAGRAIYFVLDPMSIGEMHNQPHPDILVHTLNGEFPDEQKITTELPNLEEAILRQSAAGGNRILPDVPRYVSRDIFFVKGDRR